MSTNTFIKAQHNLEREEEGTAMGQSSWFIEEGSMEQSSSVGNSIQHPLLPRGLCSGAHVNGVLILCYANKLLTHSTKAIHLSD